MALKIQVLNGLPQGGLVSSVNGKTGNILTSDLGIDQDYIIETLDDKYFDGQYSNLTGAPNMSDYVTTSAANDPQTGYAKKSELPSVDGLLNAEGVESYLTTNEYAKKSDIPSHDSFVTNDNIVTQFKTKAGYTPTRTWLVDQNYTLTGANWAEAGADGLATYTLDISGMNLTNFENVTQIQFIPKEQDTCTKDQKLKFLGASLGVKSATQTQIIFTAINKPGTGDDLPITLTAQLFEGTDAA